VEERRLGLRPAWKRKLAAAARWRRRTARPLGGPVRRRGKIAAPFKATGAPARDHWTNDVAPRYSRPALVGTRDGYGTYGGTEHLAFSACPWSWEGGLRWEGATDLGNTHRRARMPRQRRPTAGRALCALAGATSRRGLALVLPVSN
jgi:hypothetical protein